MLPDFKTWRETGSPAVNFVGDDFFPDANIMGAKSNGQAHKQKSADWFHPIPKIGTPKGPKGFMKKESVGGGVGAGAPGLPKPGQANVWGAQPNGKPFPQHMKKKLKKD